MPTCSHDELFPRPEHPPEEPHTNKHGVNFLSICQSRDTIPQHQGFPSAPSSDHRNLTGSRKLPEKSPASRPVPLAWVSLQDLPDPPRPRGRRTQTYPELALRAVQSQAPQPHRQVVDTQAAVAVDVEGLEEAPQAQLVVRAAADGAAARVPYRSRRRGGRRGGGGGVRRRGGHAAAQHTAHHRARGGGAGRRAEGGRRATGARKHAGCSPTASAGSEKPADGREGQLPGAPPRGARRRWPRPPARCRPITGRDVGSGINEGAGPPCQLEVDSNGGSRGLAAAG